jgi:ATP-dependent Lon protease
VWFKNSKPSLTFHVTLFQVCALISLLTSLSVPSTTALTGEITLRGTISPVGGIKEKVLGAHRAGVRKVILPWANRREVEMDVPGEVRREVKCVFVRTVKEAVEEAFGRGVVGWRRGGGGGREVLKGGEELGMLVESRL